MEIFIAVLLERGNKKKNKSLSSRKGELVQPSSQRGGGKKSWDSPCCGKEGGEEDAYMTFEGGRRESVWGGTRSFRSVKKTISV